MNLIPAFFKKPLQQISFTSERIRNYKVPSSLSVSDSDRAKILFDQIQEELDTELERVHTNARRIFGYKRKDLEVDTREMGCGGLVTPHFHYLVRTEMSPENPKQVTWWREISFDEKAKLPTDEQFTEAFGDELDAIVIRFEDAFDIGRLVDKIEDADLPGTDIQYDLKCTWCEIESADLEANLRLEGRDLRLVRRPGTDPSISAMLALLRSSF